MHLLNLPCTTYLSKVESTIDYVIFSLQIVGKLQFPFSSVTKKNEDRLFICSHNVPDRRKDRTCSSGTKTFKVSNAFYLFSTSVRFMYSIFQGRAQKHYALLQKQAISCNFQFVFFSTFCEDEKGTENLFGNGLYSIRYLFWDMFEWWPDRTNHFRYCRVLDAIWDFFSDFACNILIKTRVTEKYYKIAEICKKVYLERQLFRQKLNRLFYPILLNIHQILLQLLKNNSPHIFHLNFFKKGYSLNFQFNFLFHKTLLLARINHCHQNSILKKNK